MLDTIETFAITIPTMGQAGLAVPHLMRGEVLEAIWLGAAGLRLRAEKGSTWVKMSADIMAQHWQCESFMQVLETEVGKRDRCWLVPLTHAAAPLGVQPA